MALPALSLAASGLVALLLGAAAALYALATRHFAHWRRKGVPFLRPLPFAGNLKDVLLFRTHLGDLLRRVYTEKQDERFVGMFFCDQPVLLIRDISLWRTILTKDFDYFDARGFSASESDSLTRETLFSRKGQRWRDLRFELSPAFTVGKIKRFYLLLEKKACDLRKYCDRAVREGTPRDVTDVCARYVLDAITTVGFGFESRALLDDDDPLNSMLSTVFVYRKVVIPLTLAVFVNHPLVHLLKVSVVPERVARFLRTTVWAAARQRERAGLCGARGDFLDLLLELRARGRIEGDEDAPAAAAEALAVSVPDPAAAPAAATAPAAAGADVEVDGDVLIAQAYTLLTAGFDTTMTTITYALYHLAKDQSVQDALRDQLQTAVKEHGGELTYEALQSVKYLDMILSETLRMYPVLPFLDRMCSKTYCIPGTDVTLEKGTIVIASVIGIQRDPNFFRDPDRFDPERFSEERKKDIPSGAYFPFGDGPRKCIGLRLGSLQGKVGLAHIILNYRVHTCPSTPENIQFSLHSFFIHPRNGIPLKFTRV